MQGMILRYPSPGLANTIKRDSVKRESVKREPSILNNSNLTNTNTIHNASINSSSNLAFGMTAPQQKLREFGSNFQEHNTVSTINDTRSHASYDTASQEKNISNIVLSSEKLKIENMNLKQRLDYLENFIKNIVKFENTSNIIDLQSYIQTVILI